MGKLAVTSSIGKQGEEEQNSVGADILLGLRRFWSTMCFFVVRISHIGSWSPGAPSSSSSSSSSPAPRRRFCVEPLLLCSEMCLRRTFDACVVWMRSSLYGVSGASPAFALESAMSRVFKGRKRRRGVCICTEDAIVSDYEYVGQFFALLQVCDFLFSFLNGTARPTRR